MSKNILSIDIGIKNLAYCLFSYDPTTTKETIQIIDWNILNLTPLQKQGDLPPQKTTCSQCCKKSLYVSPTHIEPQQVFCEKHAQTSPFYLPTPHLQKKTLEELQQVILSKGHKHKIEQPDKKGAIIKHIKNNLLEKRKPNIKTGEISLIDVGRRLNTLLEEKIPLENLKFVIIENQIGPLAIRMRTIQGMITAYFLLKCPEAHIEYISSHNKGNLRFKNVTPLSPSNVSQVSHVKETLQEVYVASSKNKSPVENIPENEINPVEKKKTYAENKKQGVELVRRICPFSHLEFFLSHKKKDDLADCFLQGIWFVKVKNK